MTAPGVTCYQCGSAVPEGAQFCHKCGAPISPAGAYADRLPEGTRLHHDRLVVDSVLGQGGFALTYRCKNIALDTPVAIKELFPSLDGLVRRRTGGGEAEVRAGREPEFEDLLQRFRREAQILFGLRHTNAVQALDLFAENGTSYLVMEYVDGPDLERWILDRGPMSEAEAIGWIAPLADCLNRLHSMGLIHRDVSPRNILLRSTQGVQDEPVLIDFGLARDYVDGSASTRFVAYTDGYAAPESYSDVGERGPHTDVYGLSAVLYFLLTGEAPPAAPARAAGHDLKLPDALSAPVRDLLESSLALQVRERPADMVQWRERLGTGVGSASSAQGTPSAGRPVGRRFRDALRSGGEGPEMIVLPRGRFQMGSDVRSAEQPIHKVSIDYDLAMGVYPVTFEEYDRYAQATGAASREDNGWGRGRRPVIRVSWEDTKGYVRWLMDETGKRYRLPSEAEWEYACRAGTSTAYSFGEAITERDANFGGNVGQTTEVGLYPANGFGLHDMHGNVLEWVEDAWQGNYKGAPNNGSVWRGGDGKTRVLRGGSWSYTPSGVRSADRNSFSASKYSNYWGFRLVQDL